MKDLLLIDNSLFINFEVKAINIANYFGNQFLTKHAGLVFILEKAWTNKKQNLKYL